MTLRDKILNKFPFTNSKYIEEYEKIADDYAVEFAMHISTHCFCELGNDTRYYKELLEIFKKEKGL